MILITGLGRCGTSILTKYLKEVGIGIGVNVNWHENVRAGYELTTFYTLTHDLYHRFCKVKEPIDLDVECWGDYWEGRTYRQALQEVDKDERQGDVQIVKDPRVTWHPDIIEAIHEARDGDIRLIICHRKIENVMRSRKSLPENYDDPKPRKVLDEYKIDFADFYTKVLELNIEHINVFFPNFLLDFPKTYWQLTNIGLPHNFQKGYEIWGNIINKDLLKNG